MKHLLRAGFVLSLISAVVGGWGPGVASAHGHREVGENEWTVGWAEEPSFVGFKNGVQLFLENADGDPVEGAEEDLKVVVSIGDEATDPLELRTVFDSPGEYRADLIPTAPGDYTFRFTGTVGDDEVDESWTGSRDGFDEVKGATEVAFPKAAPSSSELAERLDGVEATANDAQDDLALPRILAVAGIVLGLSALIVAARPRGASS